MWKNVVVMALVVLLAVACSKMLTKEQYIDAMVELGCNATGETSPEGKKLLEVKGITESDLMNFRKKMDADQVQGMIMEISAKVIECHGIKSQQ